MIPWYLVVFVYCFSYTQRLWRAMSTILNCSSWCQGPYISFDSLAISWTRNAHPVQPTSEIANTCLMPPADWKLNLLRRMQHIFFVDTGSSIMLCSIPDRVLSDFLLRIEATTLVSLVLFKLFRLWYVSKGLSKSTVGSLESLLCPQMHTHVRQLANSLEHTRHCVHKPPENSLSLNTGLLSLSN